MADDVALIVLTFVSAHMRNCRRPTSVLKAIEILLALSRHLSDDTRLDRLMPYLVSLLQDDSAIVRATALQALTVTVRTTPWCIPEVCADDADAGRSRHAIDSGQRQRLFGIHPAEYASARIRS